MGAGASGGGITAAARPANVSAFASGASLRDRRSSTSANGSATGGDAVAGKGLAGAVTLAPSPTANSRPSKTNSTNVPEGGWAFARTPQQVFDASSNRAALRR